MSASTYLQTANINRPRNVFSGLSSSGQCPLGCDYCFVKVEGYNPNPELVIDRVEEQIAGSKVVMLACDTELFLNPSFAIKAITELIGKGVDITFATKMIIGQAHLKILSDIQNELIKTGNLLSIMVSIPIFSEDTSRKHEKKVVKPSRRIEFVKELSDMNLFPFVGIRPLLPDYVVSLDDINAIVEATAVNGNGYIIGPYWFHSNMDRFDVLQHPEIAEFVSIRIPDWLPGTEMFVYEDKPREEKIRRIIQSNGSIIHDRSSEVMGYIRENKFNK